MTVFGFLAVVPMMQGSLAGQVAKAVEALEEFEVAYETTPMGTIIEAEDTETLFAAAQAAHDAVDGDRVETTLKVDDKRTVDQRAREKVDDLAEELGREPVRDHY
ncbi:MAG: MTH1187 family thiamine-binding protein [Halococcoides sp.]